MHTAPNPRLQRTRSAPLRSPLSRKPLGDRKGHFARRVVSGLAFLGALAASASATSNRVSVVLGSLEVPSGCVSVLTGGEVDYFLGKLEGPCPQVAFATGMISVRPSAGTARDYDKLKRETLPAGELVYGIRVIDGIRVLDASIARAAFSVPLPSGAVAEDVLKLIRTYEPGQCGSCRQPIDRRPKRQYP